LNYIREINAFYDWLETNRLSLSAIALWHALMHINNKAAWTDEFAVAVSVLCVKTGLSPRGVTEARNELKNKGRITWQSRKGNQSAIYRIISLSEELQAINADNGADNRADNGADNRADNHAILNKLNKNETKQIKNTPLINPPKQIPDKIAVSEFVYLTPAEHERLLNEFGEADTSRMIEILDNYIGQNPKKNNRYTDHNRVIRGWVKDRLLEEKRKLGKVAQFKPRTNNYREEEAEVEWGYGYKPD
jgi:hypothetical protein